MLKDKSTILNDLHTLSSEATGIGSLLQQIMDNPKVQHIVAGATMLGGGSIFTDVIDKGPGIIMFVLGVLVSLYTLRVQSSTVKNRNLERELLKEQLDKLRQDKD